MKTLFVVVKGSEKPVSLSADKVEQNEVSGELVASRGAQVIGRFQLQEVAGWWLDE
jgi:hypothetical protein